MIFLVGKVNSQENSQIPEKKSYSESVFPSDVNKFPLLFVLDNKNIKESQMIKIEMQVLYFINSQKKGGLKNHLIIDKDSINNYVPNLFKYVVYTSTLSDYYKFIKPNGLSVGKRDGLNVSFYFYNRENSTPYMIYGNPHCVPHISYNDITIEPYPTKRFFIHLNRIITNLYTFGPDKTFNSELKRQIQNKRNGRIFSGGLAIGIVVAGGIVGQYLVQ